MTTAFDFNFQRALRVILNSEGGYVNDAKDPGGATNHGITQHTYDAWRRLRSLHPNDVKSISNDEVAQIYRHSYWQPMNCDPLRYAVALMVFDTAVQWGVHGTIEMLAECPILFPVADPAPTVLERLQACKNPAALVDQIYQARAAFRLARVKKKPSQLRFLLGWQNRDRKLRDLAKSTLAAT